MMLDNAISEVYKQDKKVFIPEFGAIIYSGFDDSIDFNPHLNFDDGKIISEIQKQESVSKEEAKKSLETYVEELKANLESKGTHLIGGIGYINKGEDGTLTIATSISKPVFVDEEVVDSAGTEETENEEESQNSDDVVLEEEDKLTDEPIDQNAESTIGLEETSEVEEIISEEELSDESHQELNEELIEEENFDVLETIEEEENPEESIEPDYTYQAEDDDTFQVFDEEYEPTTKRRSPILMAVLAIILLAIIAVPLYFFVVKADPTESKVSSTTVGAAEKELMKTEPVSEVNEPTIVENEPVSRTQNASDQVSPDANNPISTNEGAEKVYSLILGSFKVENNADNFEQHLDEKGIEVNKFRRNGSFYFVGIEQIPGKTNAMDLLTKLREEEEPTAWIIRKR